MGYAFGARICNSMVPARSYTLLAEGGRRQLESGYSFLAFYFVCCVLGTLTVESIPPLGNEAKPKSKNENSSLTISDVIDVGDDVVVAVAVDVVVVSHCFT